ncbi:RNA polymerase sigma factor [Umezawaea beigongshangensis]|uniref:RNA polymerase sigma factor n=1 Tax=Umezawaea beigongshangensis TaxID=2780383 RepID=UPI0018F23FE8|nr:sigma-70 family RNA polymerase sigma factor [Umezawaea beigongshangensis]
MIDAHRFGELYSDCYPRVLAYATSRVGRQLGEDVTSETFTVAWRRREVLPSPPLPWLLGVARNIVREALRGEDRQWALAAAAAEREVLGTDPASDVVERAAVLQALGSLSEPDRELLTLVAWHGLSAKDAARVLGCATATLTVRLHRARRRLERATAAAELSAPPRPAVALKEN